MKKIGVSFVVPLSKVVIDRITNAQTTQESEVTSSQGNQTDTSEKSADNKEKLRDITKSSTVKPTKIDEKGRKRKDEKVVKATKTQKIADFEKKRVKNGGGKTARFSTNETAQSLSIGESNMDVMKRSTVKEIDEKKRKRKDGKVVKATKTQKIADSEKKNNKSVTSQFLSIGESKKSVGIKQIITKMKLSQPPKIFSHKDRLLWLQKRREVGVWVQCSRKHCNKWRYLADVHDPVNVSNDWFCNNNPDINFNSCAIAEVGPSITEEEDLVYGNYTAGSIVWAKLFGYPWWPAMVDDCPDVEQYYWLDFSDIPTHYNVVFFDSDSATRAWITPEFLKPYTSARPLEDIPKKYHKRLATAKQKADAALQYQIAERLKKFSFLAQYQGKIVTPPKIRQTKASSKMHVKQRTPSPSISVSSDSARSPSPSVSISSDSVETVFTRGESWDKFVFQRFVGDVDESVTANKNACHISFNAVASRSIVEDIVESATFVKMVEPLTESRALHNRSIEPVAKLQEQNVAAYGYNTMTSETQCSEAYDAIVPTTQTELETHDFNQFSQLCNGSPDYEFEHLINN